MNLKKLIYVVCAVVAASSMAKFGSFAFKEEPVKVDFMSAQADEENEQKKGFDLGFDDKKCKDGKCDSSKEEESDEKGKQNE